MANILIVEDDSSIALAYSTVLSKQHQVQTSPDAATALQMAVANKPDVILLDMLMPGFSGLDFLRALDLKNTLPNTKVIAVSNAESAKIVEEAKQLGATKYLLKVDYTPSQIEGIIAEVLGASPTTT